MKELSNSIPRWVRLLANFLGWIGPEKFWWRYDLVDDYCKCQDCHERRSKGLQGPSRKWFWLF
jgi:hypothetical protein